MSRVVSAQPKEEIMQISNVALESKARSAAIEHSICPFRNVHHTFCPAAVMQMRIDPRREMTHCLTDNYDNCPVFLAKVLREA